VVRGLCVRGFGMAAGVFVAWGWGLGRRRRPGDVAGQGQLRRGNKRFREDVQYPPVFAFSVPFYSQ
jgi:hypothetical protein